MVDRCLCGSPPKRDERFAWPSKSRHFAEDADEDAFDFLGLRRFLSRVGDPVVFFFFFTFFLVGVATSFFEVGVDGTFPKLLLLLVVSVVTVDNSASAAPRTGDLDIELRALSPLLPFVDGGVLPSPIFFTRVLIRVLLF